MSVSRIRGPKQFNPNVLFGRTASGRGEGHEIPFREFAAKIKPLLGISAASKPAAAAAPATHGIGFFIGGTMLANELLGGVVFIKDITFISDSPYTISSQTPAAADAIFHFVTGFPDTTVGQIEFTAGSSAGVLTWNTGPYTLPAGTQLRLRSPSPADVTLAFVSGTIQGNLG